MSWTHYNDVGRCYEFCIPADDALKKSGDFIAFSTHVLRRICMDLKIPVEKISYGKWGGRTFNMSEEDIKRIENHESYKGLIQAVRVFTHGKFNDEEDTLYYFMNKWNHMNYFLWECDVVTKKQGEKYRKDFWDKSKEDLPSSQFKKLKEWSENN